MWFLDDWVDSKHIHDTSTMAAGPTHHALPVVLMCKRCPIRKIYLDRQMYLGSVGIDLEWNVAQRLLTKNAEGYQKSIICYIYIYIYIHDTKIWN